MAVRDYGRLSPMSAAVPKQVNIRRNAEKQAQFPVAHLAAATLTKRMAAVTFGIFTNYNEFGVIVR